MISQEPHDLAEPVALEGSIVLIGYGNPGRLDDGLGPALAERIGRMDPLRLDIESSYQLAVEHAELVSAHDVVIFADAAAAGQEPFQWSRLTPRLDASFTTHEVAPSTILGLAHDLFGASTRGYLLAIRGYRFDAFGEQLSPPAQKNLEAAVQMLQTIIPATRSEAR